MESSMKRDGTVSSQGGASVIHEPQPISNQPTGIALAHRGGR